MGSTFISWWRQKCYQESCQKSLLTSFFVSGGTVELVTSPSTTMQNQWSPQSLDFIMDTEDLPANNAPLTINEQVIAESAHNSHYVSLYFHEVLPKHRCTLTFHHLSSLMPHMCECSVYVHSTSNSLLVVRCLQKALLMPVFGQTLSFVCCTPVTCVLVVLVLCVLTCAWHLCSL